MKSMSLSNAAIGASWEQEVNGTSPGYPAEQRMENVKSMLYIKNMVSASCKIVVETLLEVLEFPYTKVELGVVEIPREPGEEKREQLRDILQQFGFDLITNRRSILVEK